MYRCTYIYIFFCIQQNEIPSAFSVMKPVSANLLEFANAIPWFPQCFKKEYALHATVCVL